MCPCEPWNHILCGYHRRAINAVEDVAKPPDQSYRATTERARAYLATVPPERLQAAQDRERAFRERAQDIAEGRRDPLDG
jgi:hypothetical protein